jgi:anti-sigma regulatory factor (Ser/Thr protein kinase)
LPEHRRYGDVALLAGQNVRMPEKVIELTVATRARELAAIRERLRSWLRRERATDRETFAIVLAASEACANVMEHAYGSGEATFDLRAENQGGVVGITVRDWGRWRQSQGSGRGRGISVMEAFMDQVQVSRTESGTVVSMSKRLSGGPE